jgi:nucleoside-diphosphate-sugar epimerase
MRSYEGVATVVLGASGFIGRWVARKLCEAGSQPYLVVRDSARARQIFERYGVRGKIIEAGLLDTTALGNLYNRLHPAVTFNLAGYGVDPAERDEQLAYRINTELPQTLCEAIARARDTSWLGQNLVHSGSAGEYGNLEADPREDGPARPATLYGKSKLKGTESILERCPALGIRGLVARLFTVYGPGERAGRLMPSLFEANRTGQPLDLTAGLHRRDFTYVEDVAEGLLRLGLTCGEGSTLVNLATGSLITVRSFVEVAAGVLGIPPLNLRFGALPTRPDESAYDAVPVERLRRLAGWIPPTSVAEGVLATMGSARLEFPKI